MASEPELEPEDALDISTGQAQLQSTAEEGKQPWYGRLNPLRWGKMPPIPRERTICPEYGASWLSKLTFEWMTPIMRVGYRRPLQLNDIWLVNPDRKIDLLADRFHVLFKERVARGSRYPLLWAIHDTFQTEFWHGAMYLFFASISQVMSPFTLRFLITFVTEAYEANIGRKAGPPIARGLGLVFAIMAMQVVQSVGTNHFTYHGFMVGGQARGVLITAIFEKSMRISGRARAGGRAADDQKSSGDKITREASLQRKQNFAKRFFKSNPAPGGDVKLSKDVTKAASPGNGLGWPNGRVVNLMSTDTYRVDQACGMFHLIWASPMIILIALVMLLINLTSSALAGFSLLFLGIPALAMAIKTLISRRLAINKVTDARVSLTQEILKSVRFVKFYGWGSAFLARLREIRRREIKLIQMLLTIRNAINAVSVSLPIFASMLSFIVYSLTKHELTPAPVFSSLALFNALRVPFNLLPVVIGQVTDAWASLGRIQEYLMAEEQQDEVVWDMEAKQAIVVEHAHFVWERTATQDADADDPRAKNTKTGKKDGGSENQSAVRRDEHDANGTDINVRNVAIPFALHDINCLVGRKELLAVIGTVGSGKSSLLAALAGDMRRTSGQITIGATRAFCPQYAWIQNTTLRENILFGKEMDRKWYKEVIQACALQPDLDMLPAGEETEIGERGITLSGGQKQRLNIARAIYSDSGIILMDDPLSAVDAHVARHIFDRAICGLLKDRCRILATHQLHILSRCDRILWLDEGRIKAIDTFDNLMKNEIGFQRLMASTAQEEQQEEETTNTLDDEIGLGKRDLRNVTTAKKHAGLMQEEERAVNSVPWELYAAYIQSSGTILNGLLPVFLLIVAQGANIATNLWLSYWTSKRFVLSKGEYIGIYVGLGVAQALLMFAFSVALSILSTVASRVMLDRAVDRVLNAPMSFFDTTPLGRITNRFAKDVDVMDNNLADAIRTYLLTLALIISVFILLIVFFHYSAIALAPLLILFLFAAAYYRSSAREMKRHEAILRSFMFARFGEAISGTASIRAYGLQEHFTRVLRDNIDGMHSAYYLTFSNQRWLSTRLDIISNLLVVTTGILVVTLRFTVSPSISGLVFSYILSIVQMVQLLVRQLAEVENAMNSTERLHYYGTQIEEETTFPPITEVAQSWPDKGEIHFNDVQMRYRAGLPLVLRGLDMKVAGGERIGIVGRTGAGKSSVMSALFRLNALSGGNITIDGIDIAKVPLQDLRSRLAIIPQDPILFHGTIRSNLDPFNEHTDLELWSALRQAHLIDTDAATNADRIRLDSVVEEDGLNFSLGQRQLMALARAVVRDSQIILCDEATSSVDMETDEKIQQSIMVGFKGKTLLCIAHRLKTIIGYDRICVIDQGRVAELGSPLALWQAGGIFRGMCEQSGVGREDINEDKCDDLVFDLKPSLYGVDWSKLDWSELDLGLKSFNLV